MDNNLAKNLKYLLNDSEITVSTLSAKTGVNKGQISRMMNNKTPNPSINTLSPIAKFFNISLDQLIGVQPIAKSRDFGIVIPINRLIIPIIDWALIKNWKDIYKNYIPSETVDASNDISKTSFALRIVDERYEPLFKRNSLLIVDPRLKVSNRDYTIVEQKGEVLIKQIIIDKKIIEKDLISGRIKVIKEIPENLGIIVENRH